MASILSMDIDYSDYWQFWKLMDARKEAAAAAERLDKTVVAASLEFDSKSWTG